MKKKENRELLKQFDEAFDKANLVRVEWGSELVKEQKNVLDNSIENGSLCFVVSGRPYHADPLINQKVGQILSDLGVNVLTDDVFAYSNANAEDKSLNKWQDINVVSQWSYPNRVINTAFEIARLPQNIQMIQLNSFGCGPDSFFMEEVAAILRHAGKNYTVLRIDEISSAGSIRLRCRSLIESLKAKGIGI